MWQKAEGTAQWTNTDLALVGVLSTAKRKWVYNCPLLFVVKTLLLMLKVNWLYLRDSASGTFFFFNSLCLQTNYKTSKIRSEHPPNLLPYLFKLTENFSDTMYLQMLWPLPPWISSLRTVWSLASSSDSWPPITAPREVALDSPCSCLIKTPIMTIEQNSVMNSDCYPRCLIYFCVDWESDHGESGWSLSWVSHKHIQHGRAVYWAENLVSIDNLFLFFFLHENQHIRIWEIKFRFYPLIVL